VRRISIKLENVGIAGRDLEATIAYFTVDPSRLWASACRGSLYRVGTGIR
jgi:hypothetical protein